MTGLTVQKIGAPFQAFLRWRGGEFFRNPIDGRVYIGSCARNGSVLSEVTGLEIIRRHADPMRARLLEQQGG